MIAQSRCSNYLLLSRPDFGEGDSLFPPLPEIKSSAISLQVFTHRSFYARPGHVFEDPPDDPSPDNER